MLETKDIQSIFSYIKQLHQHCPADKVPRLTRAVADTWIGALDGYTVEQVYKAAEAHARFCRFWPSLDEIVKQLPPRRTAITGGMEGDSQRRQARWCDLYREKLQEELQRLGLQAFTGNSGAEYNAWHANCEAAGIDFEAILMSTYSIAYQEGA